MLNISGIQNTPNGYYICTNSVKDNSGYNRYWVNYFRKPIRFTV